MSSEPPDTSNSSSEKQSTSDAAPEDFFAYRRHGPNRSTKHQDSEGGKKETFFDTFGATFAIVKLVVPIVIGGIVLIPIFFVTIGPPALLLILPAIGLAVLGIVIILFVNSETPKRKPYRFETVICGAGFILLVLWELSNYL